MEAQTSHIRVAHEDAYAEAGSFEAFFSSEWARLFKALLLLTGNKEEAEDVTQSAFLKLLERWDKLDHRADIQGYLFRTALNGYRSRYRRAKLAARRVLAPGRAETDPFEQVAERERAVQLLLGLTPRQREAMILTGVVGFDNQHTAALLGIKEPTVRSLLAQARERLAKETDASDA